MNTTLDLIPIQTTVLPVQPPKEDTTNDAPDLDKLAKRLSELHTEIEKSDALSVEHGTRTLKYVLESGTVLLAVQDIISQSDARWRKKGLWGKWIESKFKGDLRTAQNHMRVAGEERRRQAIMKHGNTNYVSLLDECKSTREAYRAVGIIKKKVGANKHGAGDTPRETREQFKRRNPEGYEKIQQKLQAELKQLMPQVWKDEAHLNWNLSDWNVTDGGLSCPNGNVVQILRIIASMIVCNEPFLGLTREDELRARTEVVLKQFAKKLVQENTKKTEEIPMAA